MAFPELQLEWKDERFRCRATFDVLAQIEQKVALQKLAYTIVYDRDQVPMTHVAWVFYCLLHNAGANCTPEQVWDGIRKGSVGTDELSSVMRFVIQETYEISSDNSPQQPGKAKGGGNKKGRRRRRRSSSETSTQ